MTAPGTASVFAGFRFPREVICVAVRWYLRYGLSYRDVEELLAERGITVDHVTVYRWVQRFTPEFIEAARPGRHPAAGGRVPRRRASASRPRVGTAGGYLSPRPASRTHCPMEDTSTWHAPSRRHRGSHVDRERREDRERQADECRGRE